MVMCETGEDPQSIIEARGMKQISDTGELEAIIQRIVAAHPQAVADYRSGNAKALGFFVGQVMKETRGQANPQIVNNILRTTLEKA